MVKRRVVQKGGSIARDIAEDAGRKLSGGIKRHTPEKPPGWDWGWKGGKPGEMTGGMYWDELNKLRSAERINPNTKSYKKRADAAAKNIEDFQKKVIAQIEAGGDSIYPEGVRNSPTFVLQQKHRDLYLGQKMNSYAHLEEAGFPREWTGKTLRALGGYIRIPNSVSSSYGERAEFARKLSDAMRPMTNPERELFLRLLTSWQGSIDDLVVTVRALGG